MTRQARYDAVLGWFAAHMPDAGPELQFESAFQLLVAVALSAQCTDRRVNQVTPPLFAAYPTARSMAMASADDLYPYIKSVSYPHLKAERLAGMARCLTESFGGEVPATREELMTLPGVGRKTANVVLAAWFGQAALPVDTHVFRVAHRLGLAAPSDRTPEAVERRLTAHIPARVQGRAHHWLLLFGRYTCLARRPRCPGCGMAEWCPSRRRFP